MKNGFPLCVLAVAVSFMTDSEAFSFFVFVLLVAWQGFGYFEAMCLDSKMALANK